MRRALIALAVVGSGSLSNLWANRCQAVLRHAFEVGQGGVGLVGVHGTSVSTIKYVLKHGHLPTGSRPILRGKIYFFATHRDQVGEVGLSPIRDELEVLPFEAAVSKASSYATYGHRMAFLSEALKRGVTALQTDDEFFDAVDGLLNSDDAVLVFGLPTVTRADRRYLSEQSWFRYLRSRGVTFEEMRAMHREAHAQKGVLVFFDTKIISDFEVKNGEAVPEPDEGTVILVPPNEPGVPASYIAGIEPLGDREWTEIEQLLSP